MSKKIDSKLSRNFPKPITIILLVIIIIFIIIPLPFKPSPFSYFYVKNMEKQLDKSSAPIYLPDISIYSRQRFQLFKNWVNAYAIGVNSEDGTKGAYYYQISSDSQISAGREGLDDVQIAILNDLRKNILQCEQLDADIEVCKVAPKIITEAHGQKRSYAERQFVKYTSKQDPNVLLVSELTTDAYLEAWEIKDGVEYFRYKLRSKTEIAAIIETLKNTSPQPLNGVKHLFKPEF